jgi:hypothetical protein
LRKLLLQLDGPGVLARITNDNHLAFHAFELDGSFELGQRSYDHPAITTDDSKLGARCPAKAGDRRKRRWILGGGSYVAAD